MTDQLEQSLREAFSDRADQLDHASITRLQAIDYRPRQRRIRKLPAIGALGTAGIAGVVAVVVALSSGAAPAFAGWQSTPTTPVPGQLAQAAQACGQGLGSPVLTDARGPYTAAIYANSTTDDICLTGNAVSLMSSSTSLNQVTVAAGQIQLSGSEMRDDAGNQLTLADGEVGSGVTGVTVNLSDGTSVQATVEGGWYMAWWPGAVTATNAVITTTSGTTTEAYEPHPLPPCPQGANCQGSYSATAAGPGTQSSGQTSISAGGSSSQSQTTVASSSQQ